MADAKRPIQDSDVPIETWYEGTDREIHGRALSDFGGNAKIGFGIVDLPPGSNTKPAHYHTVEEEHLYVLKGTVTLHLGNRSFSLGPGCYVHFPASQPQPHYLDNDGNEVVRYIMVGERMENDDVIYTKADEQ